MGMVLRRRERRVVSCLVVGMTLVLLLSGCRAAPRRGDGLGPGTTTGSLVSGGRDRTYVLHVPPSVAAPTALVVSLHGRLGTGAGQERLTGEDAVADAHGFVVVYPDGMQRSWADGRGTSPADRQGVDDVAFLSALVAHLVALGVDPGRVYVTGMSNGAFMAQRFACERADLVAAVAPVAGTLASGAACAPTRPVPVLEVHGTQDPLVPYGGGTVAGVGNDGTTVESAPDSFARWRALDGCSGPARNDPARTGDDGTSVVVAHATGCPSGLDVQLWTVVGGGHCWPGGEQYLPVAVVGRTSDAFSASEVSWEFFAAHPRDA